jgi:nucleoside-diphosphate kinase
MERTLGIVKPDAVGKNLIGKIVAHLEDAGFRVKAMRMVELSPVEARRFYEVHRERPFYDSLVAFMTSGPSVSMVLEREDAVAMLREVIGATDPAKAEEGTVRRLYAESVERNAIHASDSLDNARREIAFFFPDGGQVGHGVDGAGAIG